PLISKGTSTTTAASTPPTISSGATTSALPSGDSTATEMAQAPSTCATTNSGRPITAKPPAGPFPSPSRRFPNRPRWHGACSAALLCSRCGDGYDDGSQFPAIGVDADLAPCGCRTVDRLSATCPRHLLRLHHF